MQASAKRKGEVSLPSGMAGDSPFVFGGGGTGGGQTAPSFTSTHQQQTAPSSAPPPPAQHTAFQQNAQLPGLDMSALAGVSPDQVALIARLLQSGALPLPPPPSSASTAPTKASPTVPSPNAPAEPVSTKQEDVELDKEDGEVEEAEAVSTSSSRAIDAPIIPKGPRNAFSPNSSRNGARGAQQHGATLSRRSSNIGNPLSRNPSGTETTVYRAKEKQSKDFVLAMHQAGYSYRQLAEMVDDPKPLRRLFKLLGLPVSSDHGLSNGMLPPRGPSSQPRSLNAVGALTRPAEAVQKNFVAKLPAQPKQAVTADRSAYLAKLQALKAGKAGPSTDLSPMQVSTQSSVTTAASSSTAIAPTAATAASPTTLPVTSTPTSKAVKTELARQRLEAFKAERAAKQQANATSEAMASNTASVPASAAQAASPGVLGAGLHAIASRVDQQMSPVAKQVTDTPPAVAQSVFSPPMPTPSRSFSGLPGLFMNNSTQPASPPESTRPARTVSQPTVQGTLTQQSNLPRKRFVTEDLPNMSTPSKRPFGQSRSASEDESFIIENSDDEDEDTRMNMDAAAATVDVSSEASRPKPPWQKSTVGVQQGPTTIGTGADTPGGMTYEQKLKAIEELNRRIAEREGKRKPQQKAPTPTLPGISIPSGAASQFLEQQAEHPATTPLTPERPASAGAFKLKQQKEELRQRIAELENARRSAGVSVAPTGFSAPAAAPTAAVFNSPGSSGNVAADTRAEPEVATAAPAVSEALADAVASEDGEVEDESDFDFYGDEEATDAPQLVDGRAQVDSQATTVSDIADAGQQQYPLRSSSGLAEAGAAKSGALAVDRMVENMDVDSVDELSNTTGAVSEGVSRPLTGATLGTARHTSGSGPAQVHSTGLDVDIDGHDRGSDESDDDGSDLNGTLEAARSDSENFGVDELHGPLHLSDVEGDMGDADDLDGPHELVNGEDNMPDLRELVDAASQDGANAIESSDASSTKSSDSEQYEPAPADVQADETLVPQAEEEADDLAPELQPSQEAPAAKEPLDQVRSTSAWLYGN